MVNDQYIDIDEDLDDSADDQRFHAIAEAESKQSLEDYVAKMSKGDPEAEKLWRKMAESRIKFAEENGGGYVFFDTEDGDSPTSGK